MTGAELSERATFWATWGALVVGVGAVLAALGGDSGGRATLRVLGFSMVAVGAASALWALVLRVAHGHVERRHAAASTQGSGRVVIENYSPVTHHAPVIVVHQAQPPPPLPTTNTVTDTEKDHSA